jgi:radical SAM-linked protein
MDNIQRVRIEYSKKGPVRYIGHLDLMHTFFRALKRANLPVGYTQGFNPRIKCSFSPALPLGFESEAEYIELYLDKKIDIATSIDNLQKNLPDGLTVHNMNILPLFGKSSNTKIRAGAYRVNLQEFSGKSTVSGPARKKDIEGRIRNILNRKEMFFMDKRGKRVNVRPLILSIEVDGDWDIKLLLKTTQGFNLNPKIIIETLLGVDKKKLAFVQFTREKFLFW